VNNIIIAGTVNGAPALCASTSLARVKKTALAEIVRLVVQSCFSTRARIRRVCVAGEKVVISRSRQ